MATIKVGPESTYTATQQVVRSLEDHLDLIINDEYPFLRTIGLGSAGSVDNKKYEWQYDELIPVTDAVGAGGWTAGGAVLLATTGEYFKPGDLFLVEDEIIWVLAVAGDNLSVTRAMCGTTGATHAAAKVIYILGNAQVEGSSPGAARQVVTSQVYNVTQIFSEDVEIFGSETEMAEYGIAGAAKLDYRLDKRMRELYQKMERGLWYAKRNEPTDNNTPRVSGGIAQYLTTNTTNKATAVLEESDIIDELEIIYNAYGQEEVPDLMVGNSWVKRKMTGWYRGLIMTGRAERVGGARIDTIETDFGTVGLLLDHLVKGGELYLLNTRYIDSVVLGSRSFKELEATLPAKDHIARRILGEYGWRMKNEQTMAKIYGFSTTA